MKATIKSYISLILSVALFCNYSGISYAADLPVVASIIAGSATINTPDAHTMNQTNVSNRAIIYYNEFNIGAGNTVNTMHANAGDLSLHKVIDANPSSLNGAWNSNGKIFFVNTYGITSGAGFSVNMPGLVASTLDIDNSDFLAGHYRFERGGSNARIVSNGINFLQPGGFLALLSPEVRNNGIIQAPLGKITLASGDKMTVGLDSLSNLSVLITEGVSTPVPGGTGIGIDNRGIIQANGGKITLTSSSLNAALNQSINNDGIIEANTLSSVNGEIILVANNAPIVQSGGSIRADGGKITIKSRNMAWFVMLGGDIAAKDIVLNGTSSKLGGTFQADNLTLAGSGNFNLPSINIKTLAANIMGQINISNFGIGALTINPVTADQLTLVHNGGDVNVNGRVVTTGDTSITDIGGDLNTNANIVSSNGNVILSSTGDVVQGDGSVIQAKGDITVTADSDNWGGGDFKQTGAGVTLGSTGTSGKVTIAGHDLFLKSIFAGGDVNLDARHNVYFYSPIESVGGGSGWWGNSLQWRLLPQESYGSGTYVPLQSTPGWFLQPYPNAPFSLTLPAGQSISDLGIALLTDYLSANNFWLAPVGDLGPLAFNSVAMYQPNADTFVVRASTDVSGGPTAVDFEVVFFRGGEFQVNYISIGGVPSGEQLSIGDSHGHSATLPTVGMNSVWFGTAADASGVGVVQAGGNVTVNAGHAIVDQNADHMDIKAGGSITMTATAGIGSTTDPIETNASVITATNNGNGAIGIDNTHASDTTFTTTINGTGNASLSQAGGGDMVLGNTSLNNGTLTLDSTAGIRQNPATIVHASQLIANAVNNISLINTSLSSLAAKAGGDVTIINASTGLVINAIAGLCGVSGRNVSVTHNGGNLNVAAMVRGVQDVELKVVGGNLVATSSIVSENADVDLAATGDVVQGNGSVILAQGDVTVTADSDNIGGGDFKQTGLGVSLGSRGANGKVTISGNDLLLKSIFAGGDVRLDAKNNVYFYSSTESLGGGSGWWGDDVYWRLVPYEFYGTGTYVPLQYGPGSFFLQPFPNAPFPLIIPGGQNINDVGISLLLDYLSANNFWLNPIGNVGPLAFNSVAMYQPNADTFVIRASTDVSGGPTAIDFEVVFYRSGEFQINYKSVNGVPAGQQLSLGDNSGHSITIPVFDSCPECAQSVWFGGSADAAHTPVVQAGGNVTVSAGNAIVDKNDGGLDIQAGGAVTMTATAGIGSSSDPVETDAAIITATNNGNGHIAILNTHATDTTFSTTITGTGDASLGQSGGGNMVLGATNLNNGTLTLDSTAGIAQSPATVVHAAQLLANAVNNIILNNTSLSSLAAKAGGDVTIVNTSTALVINAIAGLCGVSGRNVSVTQNGGNLNVSAAVSGTQDVALTVIGGNLVATAAVTSDNADVALAATGDVVQGNGSVVLAKGDVTVTADSDNNGSGDFKQTGAGVTLGSTGASGTVSIFGNDLFLKSVFAGGDVDLKAGHNVYFYSPAESASSGGSWWGDDIYWRLVPNEFYGTGTYVPLQYGPGVFFLQPFPNAPFPLIIPGGQNINNVGISLLLDYLSANNFWLNPVGNVGPLAFNSVAMYQPNADTFVIRASTDVSGGPTAIDFEVVFYRSGEFQINYKSVNGVPSGEQLSLGDNSGHSIAIPVLDGCPDCVQSVWFGGSTAAAHLGVVRAGGDVTVNAGNAVVDQNGSQLDIKAGGAITMTATAGIGDGANPIETDSSSVSATNNGNGDIGIDNTTTAAATVNATVTGAGNIDFNQHGGDLIVQTVRANAGDVALEADNNIRDDYDQTTKITGNNLTLTAGGFIGESAPNGDIDTDADSVTAHAGGNIVIQETDGAAFALNSTTGTSNVLAHGASTLGASTVAGNFTFRTTNGNLGFNGTTTSSNGGAFIYVDNGDMVALSAGPHVVAANDSYFGMPHGIIGVPNPIDVNIGGQLTVDIGGDPVGGRVGYMTGVVGNSSRGPIPYLDPTNYPTPLYPNGQVYFNNLLIWPPQPVVNPVVTPDQATVVAGDLAYRYMFPHAEKLSPNQVSKMDAMTSYAMSGPIFFYHPLSEVNSGSYDNFQLEEGAYDFIDGQINLKEEEEKKAAN